VSFEQLEAELLKGQKLPAGHLLHAYCYCCCGLPSCSLRTNAAAHFVYSLLASRRLISVCCCCCCNCSQSGAPVSFEQLEAELLKGQKLQGVLTSNEVQVRRGQLRSCHGAVCARDNFIAGAAARCRLAGCRLVLLRHPRWLSSVVVMHHDHSRSLLHHSKGARVQQHLQYRQYTIPACFRTHHITYIVTL
jgi:hypothetical protein